MGNCVGSKGPKKDPKILTEEEIKLLLDNTRLSRQQIIALHRNFLKECPTGKLTKKDFIKLFKEVHPSENKKEKADKFCEYVFKVIDSANLGYISFQDFVLCFSLTSDGDFRQKCEFAFKLYDLDKDGKISKKEMTQVLTALYDLSGITDRKKNNAPAKKVEEIIRKINVTYQPPPADPAAPASADDKKAQKKAEKERKAREAKEKKEREKEKKEREKKDKKDGKSKKEKPIKVTVTKGSSKGPEYITKDQFIDACSSDETLKKLFVDSIFCNQGDSDNALNSLTTNNAVSVEVNPGSLSPKSLHITAPKVEVNTTDAEPAADSSASTGGVLLELKPPQVTLDANNDNNNNSEQNTSDVNGVYNIREETNFVTTHQVATPAVSVEVNTPEVTVNTESTNEEKKEDESQPQPQPTPEQ